MRFRSQLEHKFKPKSIPNRPHGFNWLFESWLIFWSPIDVRRKRCEHPAKHGSKHARQFQNWIFMEILTKFWSLNYKMIRMGPRISQLHWFRKPTVTWPEAILPRASSPVSSAPNRKLLKILISWLYFKKGTKQGLWTSPIFDFEKKPIAVTWPKVSVWSQVNT